MDGWLDSFRAPLKGIVHQFSVGFQDIQPVRMNDLADFCQDGIHGGGIGLPAVQQFRDADDGFIGLADLLIIHTVLVFPVNI